MRRDFAGAIGGLVLVLSPMWLGGCELWLGAAIGQQETVAAQHAAAIMAERPCRDLPCDRDGWAVLRLAPDGVTQFWPLPRADVLPAIPRDAADRNAPYAVQFDVSAAEARVAVVRTDGVLLMGALGQADVTEVDAGVGGVGWANRSGELAVVRLATETEPTRLAILDAELRVRSEYDLPMRVEELRFALAPHTSWSADDRYVLVTRGQTFDPSPALPGAGLETPAVQTALVDLETGVVQGSIYPLWFVGERQMVSCWQESRELGVGWVTNRFYGRSAELVDGVIVMGDEIGDVYAVYDTDPLTGVFLHETWDHPSSWPRLRDYMAVRTVSAPGGEYVSTEPVGQWGRPAYALVPWAAVADVLVTETVE